MRMLIRLMLTTLALVLLSSSTFANCGADHYAGGSDDNYVAENDDYGPGLTAAETEAYGPTAVAGDYAVRGMAAMPSQAQMALRQGLIKLWEDHIVYTRNVIVGVASDSPSVSAVVARLMENQSEIGNAIKPYYGNAAGDQLTALLKDHIKWAGEAVKALKANDAAKATNATNQLYANADQLAAFLGKANPNWPEPAVKQMLYTHLDLLAKQAKAELGGDWQGSIKAYDDGHKAILQMANALADGIIKQFPDKF